MRPTPALDQLVGGYFHQDFVQDFGDDRGAVSAYLAHDPDVAPRLIADIDRALAEYPTPEALETFLDRLGCEFYPARLGGDYRAWLVAVRAQVADVLARAADVD